jgi:UDP-4-amino-4,6-dideoxy-N-acetyl-beta-L-altrosamine transaminase
VIPYGRQTINQADIDAVVEVLKSDFLTQGPAVPQFEKKVSEYCGADHAVAVNSATSALHIACLALGLGPGDILWTSPVTFVASANCALYCGASVDFVDIDPASYNISVSALAAKLAAAGKVGRLPKIVIPVHLCGQSCEMAAIQLLGKQYGFKIIEDASHAIGGTYQGAPVGNCRYSDVAVFSFHPVKIITTGEGGMAVTNDSRLARIMQRIRSHGITRAEAEMTRPSDGPWYYQQTELGFNYRLTDIQAALGSSQMHRLNEFVAMRRTIAKRYDTLLTGLPLQIPWQHPDACSSYHLYVVRLKLGGIGKTHRQVFDALKEQGISVNLHYIPIYRQPYYEGMGFRRGNFEEAERYYSEAISIPIFPGLCEAQQDQVVNVMTNVIKS